MAYWNDEEPKVVRVAGMELRYYAKAGKLQIYQVDPKRVHGVTKGVVASVGDQSLDDLAMLSVAIDQMIYESVSELMTLEDWQSFKSNVKLDQ